MTVSSALFPAHSRPLSGDMASIAQTPCGSPSLSRYLVCDRKREMPSPRTNQGPHNGKSGHCKNGGSNESSNMPKIIYQKKSACRIWLLLQDGAECTSLANSGRRRACGHEFLLRRRIQHAEELLRNTTMPIVEIALTVGFQTQAHLTTVFKRFAGCTP